LPARVKLKPRNCWPIRCLFTKVGKLFPGELLPVFREYKKMLIKCGQNLWGAVKRFRALTC